MALRGQPAHGRLRKQRAQAGAWHEKVRAAGAGKQGVLQHAQKHRAAGLCGRQIQGRDAQRLNEFIHQALRQALAKLGHGGIFGADKALQAPARGAGQQGQALAQAPALGGGYAGDGIQRRRPAGQLQARAISVAQRHWLAQQRLLNVYAHGLHQAQAFSIGANQNVLAVISLGGLLGGASGVACLGRVCRPGKIEAAGPATGLAGGFIHRDLGAGLCQRHRCGHAGPAATDDGYVQRICHGYCLAARHKASCSACRLACMGAWQRRLTSRCASRLPALAA